MAVHKFRTILHVDLDAFYAAVEQRDRPELKGKPVIVGADPKGGSGRGVVATASYEARQFGIRSAMPISQAYRLCPRGIYVHPDMEKYQEESGKLLDIFSKYTDLLEPASIDEAFLDVTGSQLLFGTGAEIAKKIKQDVQDYRQLTCSIGVATNKFLAKVASDLKKPDGLTVVNPGEEKEFLAPLPIRRLWGVGPKMEAVLLAMSFTKISDIQAASNEALSQKFGNWGGILWELANGHDETPVYVGQESKSIGHEDTFEKDTNNREILYRKLLDLAERVACRLREHQLRGRTIVLKFRYSNFTTFTRRQTIHESVQTAQPIYEIVTVLFDKAYQPSQKIRLLGVYVTNLEPSQDSSPTGLFSSLPVDDKLAKALDKISVKYGRSAIKRAALQRTKEENLL